MIIQNLHNKLTRTEKKLKLVTFSFFLLSSFIVKAQDSISVKEYAKERDVIKFQQHFFKALSEKAIYNYQKAINNLEECNRILPNNKAVLFELSKNYLKLNRTYEALQFNNEALKNDPDNLWLLEHNVAIYKKDRNFTEAIKTQERIGELFPKKRKNLVYLHLQNNDITSAKKILTELEDAKLLDGRLKRIQQKIADFSKPKIKKTTTPKTTENVDLRTQFNNTKSFASLQKLLNKLFSDNNTDLLKFSEQGLQLFPAQPFVYLMNGRALIMQKKYKKAITNLQIGIDFVIDDKKMESNFYKALIKAYNAIGDSKNRNKNQKKLDSL